MMNTTLFISDVASILTVEELTPMSGNVSWTCKPVTFTLHTVNRSMVGTKY